MEPTPSTSGEWGVLGEVETTPSFLRVEALLPGLSEAAMGPTSQRQQLNGAQLRASFASSALQV